MKEVPKSVALGIPGVRAIFTEAYPDPVRVVSIGVDVNDLISASPSSSSSPSHSPSSPSSPSPSASIPVPFSIELCGGTHIKNTSEVESFVIVTEKKYGEGVRRIEAVTGSLARSCSEDGIRLKNLFEYSSTLSEEKLQKVLPELKQDLENTMIPVHIRMELTSLIKKLEAKTLKHGKGKHKQKLMFTKNFLEGVHETLKNDTNLQVISLVLDVGGDNQILNDCCVEIVNYSKENFGRDVAVFLVSKDSSSKKSRVNFAAKVPPSLITRGLTSGNGSLLLLKNLAEKEKEAITEK